MNTTSEIDVSYLIYVYLDDHSEPVKVWTRSQIYENELELYSITNMDDVEMIECFNDWFIEKVREEVVQEAFEDKMLVEEYPDKRFGEL